MSQEVQSFLDLVKDFKEVTPEEADTLLSTKEGTVVFIGRPTCPYCRKFAPKLHQVSKELNIDVYFTNSEHPDHTDALTAFRNKYNVPTVPGLLYAGSEGVSTRCDSSMSPEEITTFVGA